jgi:hypothetical protein
MKEKGINLLENDEVPGYYFMKREDAEFKDDLIRYQTELIRKLCGQDKFKESYQIIRATDGSSWLNAFQPLISSLDEMVYRDAYI